MIFHGETVLKGNDFIATSKEKSLPTFSTREIMLFLCFDMCGHQHISSEQKKPLSCTCISR